jgi:hypothetical protein
MIKIETPDTVTVQLAAPNGDAMEIVFTRAEYTEIEIAALVAGVPVDRWIVEKCLDQVSKSPTLASERGVA